MTPRSPHAVAAFLTLVTGCVVGPNYMRPPVVTPDVYKEWKDWKVAQPSDEALRGPWWQMFGDPDLDALAEQVDISNQNIAQAEAQYREALALVREARAGYFPTVSIGVGVVRSRTSGKTANDYTLPINASWEPDLWGRVRRAVESQQASAQASAADLETARLSVRASLAQNYWLLRAQDARQHLLDTTVARYEKALQLTRNQYEAGIVSRADVLQAETQLETARAQAIDVGVQRTQLEHAIAVLLGRPPAMLSLPARPLTANPPAVPTGIPSELLERRPDVAAAERAAAAANAQIGVAKAAYFPTVTLSVEGGFQGTSPRGGSPGRCASGRWAGRSRRPCTTPVSGARRPTRRARHTMRASPRIAKPCSPRSRPSRTTSPRSASSRRKRGCRTGP